ncbi:MAG: tetratricopeptide repeat protein, partial [Pseudomonadota bacterium]|nr:tetratricopeptide repeat protein [Pseudomonadota bacterium]
KMLMPILAKLADEYQGQLILAKVNTDEQRELASEYGIRSLPTLKLFRHRQAVEEIIGMQPETTIRAIIERYRERPADKLRQQALQAQAQGNSDEALSLLVTAQTNEPDYYPIQLDRIKILIEMQRLTEAEQLIKALPANIQTEPEVDKLLAKINFSLITSQAPDINQLEQILAAEPDNHRARYQLGAQKVLTHEYELAMEHFLELMRRDRKFEDDAGRKSLLSVFALLDNQGQLVNRFRNKMSSLLY